MMRQKPVHTREEALKRAEEWSTGERSHMSNYSGRATYAEIAQMNTAEVQKFCALAAVLPEARHVDDTEKSPPHLLDAALPVIEGYAHYCYGTAGKIAVDFLVENEIWSPNSDTRERVDPVYEVAAQLVKLIVLDFPAATNADLAADGPVGDEEGRLFEVITAKAKVLSEYLDRSMTLERPSDGARAIELERAEQRKRWGDEHDDEHERGELLYAALCYAQFRLHDRDYPPERVPAAWPFEPENWHAHRDRRRNLVKAGALIAAEIDRLDRLVDR
jgi:hypothetical protein